MSELIPTNTQGDSTGTGDVPTPDTSAAESSSRPEPTLTRALVAFVVAVAADLAFIPGEMYPVAFDIMVAVALAIVLRGRYWGALLPALILEAIPGVGVAPLWTLTLLGILGARAYSDRRNSAN